MHYFWKLLLHGVVGVIFVYSLPLAALVWISMWLDRKVHPEFYPPISGLDHCCKLLADPETNGDQQAEATSRAMMLIAEVTEKMQKEHPELIAKVQKLVHEKVFEAHKQKPSQPS